MNDLKNKEDSFDEMYSHLFKELTGPKALLSDEDAIAVINIIDGVCHVCFEGDRFGCTCWRDD